MIQHDNLIPYAERYRSLPMTGVYVNIVMRAGTHTANYEPINFDGVLAWCVTQEATRGRGLPKSSEPYDLPVPLQTIWRDGRGLPLHATSALLKPQEMAEDTVYLHKRMQTGRFSYAKKGVLNLEGIKGRWMERRVPMPTAVYPYCEAYCIGNFEEICRLMQYITNIGKRRNSGHGEIEEVIIEEMPGLTVRDCFIHGGALTRAFPLAAAHLLEGVQPAGSIGLVSFTPPYWLAGLEVPGWFPGTPCEVKAEAV